MLNDMKCVSILDGSGSSNMIDYFIPNDKGKYQVPLIANPENVYNNCLSLVKASYTPHDATLIPRYKIAILDTGILSDHPIFKRYIKEYIDFTGEGITDGNGHGSLVTWLYLVRGERAITEADAGLYICKILTSDGLGTEENIIKGIKWAQSKNVRFINLSAGIDNKRWFGLRACDGSCEVCKTAYSLKDENIMLFAAAGNNVATVCPAKVALNFEDAPAMAVGAINNESGEKQAWSGEGNIYSTDTIPVAEKVLLT